MEQTEQKILYLLEMLDEDELRIVYFFILGMLREKRGK